MIILKVLIFSNKQTTQSLFRGFFRLSGSTPKLPERLPEPWNGVWKCLIPDWAAILVEALWVHTVTPEKKFMFTSSTFHCGEAAYCINTQRVFLLLQLPPCWKCFTSTTYKWLSAGEVLWGNTLCTTAVFCTFLPLDFYK